MDRAPMAVTMARDVNTDARSLKALGLRLAGTSYRTIGRMLDVSYTQAHRDVHYMLKEVVSEPAEQVRHAELARLDRLMLAHWPAAIKGDYWATTVVLQIMDRRIRLLGLDAPHRIDITGWIRERATAEGLDPYQAVADADAFVRDCGL